MSAPRIDQLNVVLGDVDGAAHFLVRLGLELPAGPPGWEAHHRTIPTATSRHVGHDLEEATFGLEFDSSAFAQQWGGLPPAFTGVVVNVRVDDRSDVDRLYELALATGGRPLTPPYDAFWGSRYATVEGPGPLAVGIMSVPDPARRSAPPDPDMLG